MRFPKLLLPLTALVGAGALNVQPALAFNGKVDLISPTTCTKVAGDEDLPGRLVNCVIPERTVSGAVGETAVPVRTRVKAVVKGNCTTQYQLAVKLEAPGEAPVEMLYLRNAEAIVRTKGRTPIASLKVTDGSVFGHRSLSVLDTCRVSLDVIANEVDVSTKAEAQAVIAGIEKQLADKKTEAEYYGHLVQYHRAFLFLQAVATNFHGELTNELIQQLRRGAEGALSSLSMLSSECTDNMQDADRENIMLLLMSLPQLGSAQDWENPDGSIKTLADLLGPEAKDVYETVDRLAKEHDGSNGSKYDEAYRKATAEVVALEDKLELAKLQLKKWL